MAITKYKDRPMTVVHGEHFRSQLSLWLRPVWYAGQARDTQLEPLPNFDII